MQESHIPADLAAPILEQTIGDMLRAAALDAGERVFLVDGVADPVERRRLSYAEVLRKSERMAGFLCSRFERGENIAVWAPNRLEWVLLQFGAALAGITLVMVNPALKREEVRYILRQSNTVALFLERTSRGNPTFEIATALRPELPHLRELLLFEDWENFEPHHGGSALPELDSRCPAMIQYTSGTTGTPKGAVLSHQGVVNDSRFVEACLDLPKHSVWLMSAPLFHTGGSVYHLLSSLWNRGVLVVLRQFDAELLIDLVEQEKVNFFSAVPTVHLRVVEHPAFRTDRVRSLLRIGSGGSTVPEEVVRRLERSYGAHYLVTFGQTETSASITHSRVTDTVDQKACTVGTPLPGIELKVIDVASGAIVARGTAGEVCVRGFCVMLEYFDLPDKTAETIDASGWLHTGDIGILRDDGYLQITGRLKDVIRSGGESIVPREVEDVLSLHNSVAESCVLGLPDRVWGEQVAAVVRLERGASCSEHELAQYLRERIAGHKIPKRWLFIEEFPQTATGKIKRFELRQLFA